MMMMMKGHLINLHFITTQVLPLVYIGKKSQTMAIYKVFTIF
jgi:hypothetical protein